MRCPSMAAPFSRHPSVVLLVYLRRAFPLVVNLLCAIAYRFDAVDIGRIVDRKSRHRSRWQHRIVIG